MKLTKELIKNALALDFVQANLEGNFDIIEWKNFFKLPIAIDEKKHNKANWGSKLRKDNSRLFCRALIECIDHQKLDESFFDEFIDGVYYCLNECGPSDIYEYSIYDVLSGMMPTEEKAQAYGYKNFYMIKHPTGEYEFFKSEKEVDDEMSELYQEQRYLLTEEDWQEYFPGKDLDEVFGFKRDPKKDL